MCEIPPLQAPGSYPLEPLPEGWKNVLVRLTRTNGQASRRYEVLEVDTGTSSPSEPLNSQELRRYEILEVNTGKLYPQEPLNAIAFKCFGLFVLVNPIYFFFYTALHSLRVFIVPIVNISPLCIFKEVWKIVQIPFLCIGMQFAALVGVFKPLQGRQLFGSLESLLHDGKTRRDAEQSQKTERTNSGEVIWDCLCEENPRTAFFVAFCMQPYDRIYPA